MSHLIHSTNYDFNYFFQEVVNSWSKRVFHVPCPYF
jgi:hypothetical protein